GNFGWNVKEGSFFFDPNGEDNGFVTDQPPASGLPADLIDPVAEYDHDEGIAVVGGLVYRGTQIPELAGRYVFGDYGTADGGGRLFFIDENEQIQELTLAGGAALARRVLGFGQDADGELYVLANETGTPFGATGVVLRIDSAANSPVDPGAGELPSGGGAFGYPATAILLYMLWLSARRRRP